MISPNYVLTSAHCAGNKAESVFVILGVHNISIPEGQQQFNVTEVLIHPMWNPTSMLYDFAILRLNSSVVISHNDIGLACLPNDATQDFNGTKLVASGWGNTNNSAFSFSEVLKATYLRGVTTGECSDAFVFPRMVDSFQFICATGKDINSSLCTGDDGG